MSSDEKYDKIINISSCKYTYNLPIHKDFIKKINEMNYYKKCASIEDNEVNLYVIWEGSLFV